MGGLLSELKNRNVLRVAAAYAVLSWLLLQVADIILPAFSVPDWTFRLLVLVLALGFIPVLLFSWAYELTPEGLTRESEIDRSQSIPKHAGRRLDLITIGMLVLVLAIIFVDRMLPEGPVEEVADSAPHDYSIAVLAFEDLSDTRDQEYFSDGLAEELLNKLAKLDGFRVAGRTSSFAFKDRPDDLRVIGEKLNVATILEGSVRKAGDQLRITAQLINVADGFHLWSETYDRRLDNVFAIQDEIAESVVTALQVTLLGSSDPVQLEQTAVTDTRSFELYLRGRHQLWKRRPEPLRQAQALFEQAIEIDPGYAPPYAGLSDALVFQLFRGLRDEARTYPRAEAALARALAVDPGNAAALAGLGLLRLQQGRIEEAREFLEQAIARNPNNAQAHNWLASTYSVADPARAFSLSEKAYAIDPLARLPIDHLVHRSAYFGRSAEAFELAREMQFLYPESGWGYQLAGDVNFAIGHLDLALKSYFRAYRTAADWAGTLESVPFIFFNLSEYALAAAWVTELKQLASENRFLLILERDLALVHGQPEQALRSMHEAAERHEDLWFKHRLGRTQMLSGDFVAARSTMEGILLEPGQEIPEFDPDRWPDFIDYAIVLQRTGAAVRTAPLIAEAMALLEAQIVAGVVVGPVAYTLQTHLAQLHAISDNRDQAMTALRRAASQGGLTCLWCLRLEPHFDSLRDDADFISLIGEQEAKIAVQRQRLADEGMLLTPEEVLQLQDFSFNPFLIE